MTLTKEQRAKLEKEIYEEIFLNVKTYMGFIEDTIEFVIKSWDEKTLLESAKVMGLRE